MKNIILKIVIVFLTTLSSFYLFYEYDNYKRQYSSAVFKYKEGIYENFNSANELYQNETQSYLILINRFEQLFYINLIIVILVVIYFWLNRKQLL